MSLWGSRASPFASAEQACRMYSRGLRQLACWTKSEYQRIAFMLSTCPEPGKEVREDTRRVQACASSEAPVRPGVLFAVAGFEALPGLQGGKSGGFASSVASIRHRTWRLARPERVCTCPSHSSTGAPDTSTSSTVPGIVQSARRPAGRAGALRADVVVVPVAAALSRGIADEVSRLASCAVRGQVDAEQLEMLARFQLLADRDAGLPSSGGSGSGGRIQTPRAPGHPCGGEVRVVFAHAHDSKAS
eukprot:tig00000704_g3297.t2